MDFLSSLVFFPGEAAVAGILVLALADPAACLVGRKWGRRRLGKGTVVGSSAFLLVSFLVLLWFLPWAPALGVALAASVVEVLPWPLDDKVTIPLAVAGTLVFLS